ncbi:hypothetical protein C1646_666861 [Rhizophagus diaphanus]|nr:hypothetical protein C1646_666861 [Rhizophagus diaphanus] [Rhizophagus sp. MUCL 43196]
MAKHATCMIPVLCSKPCYLPKLKEGQILSISNSKISKGSNGELDLILTSASVLNMAPEDLPTHQITAVGIASASNTAVISELGVQVEYLTCYLGTQKSHIDKVNVEEEYPVKFRTKPFSSSSLKA